MEIVAQLEAMSLCDIGNLQSDGLPERANEITELLPHRWTSSKILNYSL